MPGGIGGYEPALASDGVAKSRLELVSVNNGYFVTFQKGCDPAMPMPAMPAPPTDEGMSEDERIDVMVDAITAFFSRIHGSDGEDWKDNDREKIRAGFKMMAPGVTHQHRTYTPPPQPEQLVFKTKAELITFITENF